VSPSISLLIPCFNAARFLPRLMASVRAQTEPFPAIICYDDGSTDDTVAVARSLGLEILTGNPNRGVAHARNELAARAGTEWIHFHDADDKIAPAFLSRLAPLCDDGCDVVSCDADWIGEEEGKLQIAWRYDPDGIASDPVGELLRRPLGLNNSIIRRGLWLGAGGCDESFRMWEDADLHFRLALGGARWRHVPEVLTWSIRNPASFSHDYRQNCRQHLQFLAKHAADPQCARLRPEFARQAEVIATTLLNLGDVPGARDAARFARGLGLRIPSSRHPAWTVMRPFLPDLTLLRLQNWLRREPTL
jgi:glycosyltransferase involved in cell wall biosynthesis